MKFNRRDFTLLTLGLSASLATPAFTKEKSKGFARPLIIGHRGAPAYAPEHTYLSYETAVKMGADFIEPDIVSTKDGHLIVRHDPFLGDSTDVASKPEFANRKRKIDFQGFSIEEYFTFDFTLAEIKTLRAKQVMAIRNHSNDFKFEVLTFEEVIDFKNKLEIKYRRKIGLVPEIKYSTYHSQIGLGIEDKFLDIIKRTNLNNANSNLIIQSFETANLQYLRGKTNAKLLQLIDGSDIDTKTGKVTLEAPENKPYDWVISGKSGDYSDMLTQDGLKEIATYADIVCPWKRYLISFKKDENGNSVAVENLQIVKAAHELGLKVFIYTMRDEAKYLDSYYGGNPELEYRHFFKLGIDGLFSDSPDTAFKARKIYMSKSAK